MSCLYSNPGLGALNTNVMPMESGPSRACQSRLLHAIRGLPTSTLPTSSTVVIGWTTVRPAIRSTHVRRSSFQTDRFRTDVPTKACSTRVPHPPAAVPANHVIGLPRQLVLRQPQFPLRQSSSAKSGFRWLCSRKPHSLSWLALNRSASWNLLPGAARL